MKNVKILSWFACLLTLIFVGYIHARPPYAVLLFMESSERTHQEEYVDLAGMAIKNIADLLHDYQDRAIPVYIEWHNAGNTAWRLSLDNRGITSHGIVYLNNVIQDNLYESMKWMINDVDAEHYALILWGHADGIIDFAWNEHTSHWESFYEALNKKRNLLASDQSTSVREEHSKNTLSIADLGKSLTRISSELLLGKRLAFVGMDTGIMSMIEVADQIKDASHFLIAPQGTGTLDGWPYAAILHALVDSDCSPSECAIMIVNELEEMHLQDDCCAALDLDTINALCDALDEVVECCTTDLLLQLAREARINLWAPACLIGKQYVDLADWCERYYDLIQQHGAHSAQAPLLMEALQRCIATLHEVVIACTQSDRALHGISIYFPQIQIDPNYCKTYFARHTRWPSFIASLCQSKSVV